MAISRMNCIVHCLRSVVSVAGDSGPRDAKLLESFITRLDAAAFEALVRRHGPMVLGVCRRVLKNAHDAEDAFQATFVVLARKAASIGRRELLANWLYGVAHRTALGARAAAAKRRSKERQVGAMPEREAVAETGASLDVQPLLDQELCRLPDKYRVPVLLCDLEGHTRKKAARQLGIPEGTLSGRLTTARRMLARRLKRRGVVLSAGGLAGVPFGPGAMAGVPTPLVVSTVKAATAVAAGQAGAAGAIAPGVAALAEMVVRNMLLTKLKIATALLVLALLVGMGMGAWAFAGGAAADPPKASRLIRSAQNGPWSAPATWEGAEVPGAGAEVLIRKGHAVTYDAESKAAIRSVYVAGTLTFARDRNTLLDVGLIKIQPGEEVNEDGFDCDAHVPQRKAGEPQPALEVGTPNQPIPAKYTATIRLRYAAGMDKDSCPAIVCCGGRMDFHGAPLSRTWVKLGATAKAKAAQVELAEAVTGWQVGDRVILTATTRQTKTADKGAKPTFKPSVRDNPLTEERVVKAIKDKTLTLEKPLDYDHTADGDYRGEAANLSRNVVVESADPDGPRGHTMYHRNSAGSIGYAEFRHLGKEGVLGKYALHYHLVGDTMRGSSVVGASIWDSANRWLTIHGTNYLVVRDCVGYKSVGHGFFMEDGTEVYNVLDRNLAVEAFIGKPLPRQILSYDKNDGAGFWWANSLNTFTRNVACECDEYGYFFQATKTADFDPVLPVLQPDGSRKKVDIRTLPFVRFEDNEAHCQRRHAFNLGGGVPFGEPNVGGVGPDAKHPFVIRNLRVWNVHWAFHPVSPCVIVDNMDVYDAHYGVWRPTYDKHAYRGVKLTKVDNPEFSATGTKPEEADYPKPLEPTDDLPPVTVITHVRHAEGKLVVRGTTSDNGMVKRVTVNGQEAKALAPNFAQWEVVLDDTGRGAVRLVAQAEGAPGNVEKVPHTLVVPLGAARH